MGSKFDDSLLNMVGNFTNLNRTPDFKAKSDIKHKNPISKRVRLYERQHSLNLTVGVSDEEPPYSLEMRSRIQRQATSSATTSNDKFFWQDRRISAPAEMKNDIDKLCKKMAPLRTSSSLKDATLEEEEDGAVQELRNLPPTSSKILQRKEALERLERPSASAPTSPFLKHESHTVIMNMGHRGSMVFIDDDDTTQSNQMSSDRNE